MKCPNCNREVENDSVFCEWCGSKIQDVINLKAKEEMVTLFLEKSAKLFPKSKISVIQERLLNVSSEQLEKILSCDYEEVFTESYKTRIVLGFILQVITISILIALYYTSIFYWHYPIKQKYKRKKIKKSNELNNIKDNITYHKHPNIF